MFVKLENGELLNLAYAVRIFVERRSSEICSVEVQYVNGDKLVIGVICRGTESQCNQAFDNLGNSLDIVSAELFPR